MYDFSEIEVFSLFIACLCHDIDHRGTTNSYHVQSVSLGVIFMMLTLLNLLTYFVIYFICHCFQNSPLAALYSSEGSVLEVGTTWHVPFMQEHF